MVSVVNLVLMGTLIVLRTFVTTVMTRFFHLRLKMQWGCVLYALFLILLVLLVLMLVFSDVLGIGANLGSPTVALGVMTGMPFASDFAIDTLCVPSPEEYENLLNPW